MILEPGGPLDGPSVAEVQRVLPESSRIVYFERGGEGAGQISPDKVLGGGDFLTLIGDTDAVLDLHEVSELASSRQPHLPYEFRSARHAYFEVVIAPESPLVGRSLAERRMGRDAAMRP